MNLGHVTEASQVRWGQVPRNLETRHDTGSIGLPVCIQM